MSKSAEATTDSEHPVTLKRSRGYRSPITRWSISLLLDRRLCSDQPFRRFPRVHVMLSILRGPGGGAAGVWDDNLDDMTRPAGLAGTCSRGGGQRRHALNAWHRHVPPRCACTVQQHCRDCGEGRGRRCDQNDLPAGHAADDHGVDHDLSGVASAAWFRRQSGESGGRGCGGRQDGAGQRSHDGGETGDEAGVMDTVPRDILVLPSVCGSVPCTLGMAGLVLGWPARLAAGSGKASRRRPLR